MATPQTIAPQNPSPFTPSELASFLSGLVDGAAADHKARLRQAAQHFRALAETPPTPLTYAQREEIRRLCAHPLLPKREKTMTLLAYVRFDKEQAAACIRKLQSQLSALEDLQLTA